MTGPGLAVNGFALGELLWRSLDPQAKHGALCADAAVAATRTALPGWGWGVAIGPVSHGGGDGG